MPRIRAVVSLEEDGAADASVCSSFVRSAPAAPVLAAAPCSSVVAAVSLRTGAGLSGSSAPSFCSSIQRTTSLLSYVWMALNTSWSASSGSWPTESGNCWNWPGRMPRSFLLPSADQVTLETASLILLPWTSSGLASLLLVTTIFQPGTGCGITEASGWSVGKLTSSLVVEALSRSLGTLKLIVA